MNKTVLLVLLALCLIFGATAAWLSRHKAPQTELDSQVLFPLLRDHINDASYITVHGRRGTVELEGRGQDWVVLSHGGYPAEFPRIKTLLLNYAEAKRREDKTSNPERYEKLGVQSLDDDPDSPARYVEIKPHTGPNLVDVIVGEQVPALVTTYYARFSDDPRSFRVEGDLEVSEEVVDWIETRLVDIKSDRIREINIMRETDPLRVYRDSRDEENFKLADVPAGRKIKSQTVLDSLGSVLEDLHAQDVLAASDHEFSARSVVTEVRTFDALIARVTLDEKDESSAYARFQFSTDPKANAGDAAADGDDAGEDGEAENGAKDGETDDSETVSSDVRREVRDLNAVLGDWVYVISYYKYDMLNRNMSALVEDENASEEDAPSPSSSGGDGEADETADKP